MFNVVGLDIGGANTKAVFLVVESGCVKKFESVISYFPFWKHKCKDFVSFLLNQKRLLVGSRQVDYVGVTMTAELADVFSTKKMGVRQILDCVLKVYGQAKVFVLDVDATLRSVTEAKAEPLVVASANWAGSGWMISQFIDNCVVVDVGSTSTSIIPVLNSKIVVEGKNDLEKLMNGELVYTGGLRTNVAAIVQTVTVKGRCTRVSSEFFAQSADVHLVLGNISSDEYSCETANGKAKTKKESFRRLSRVVCADTDMLSEDEIVQVAKQIYEAQIGQIASGLNQVYCRFKLEDKEMLPVVIMGIGKTFLGAKAARKVGVKKVVDCTDLFLENSVLMVPAVAVGVLVASKVEGKFVKW